MYISGNALVVLGGPHKLLQTIYVDDTDALEAVTVDEASGKIAVCGGPDVFIYQPYGIQHETLKVRLPCRVAGRAMFPHALRKIANRDCAFGVR